MITISNVVLDVAIQKSGLQEESESVVRVPFKQYGGAKNIAAGVSLRLSRIATNQLPQFTDRASMVLVPVCHCMAVGAEHTHVGSWVDSCCS